MLLLENCVKGVFLAGCNGDTERFHTVFPSPEYNPLHVASFVVIVAVR
jgi:hypothetical protein